MLVVDASALAPALADDGPDGDAARARLRGEDLVAPELRESLTAYDAAYVALAELLGVVLLTADAHLARAPGPRCELELLA